MSSRIQAAVAAAALVLVACSGSKGDPGPIGPSGPSGPAGVAGPSGPSGPSGPAAVAGGRLRAYLNDGTDLGFVYAVFPMPVTLGPTPTAGTLGMLLLKQQAPGAASPVLLYRTPLSGAATTCTVAYESADCTPTAGWPITVAPASGGACVDPDGRAWVAPAGATPQTITPGSRKFALWDGPTQTVTGWSCVPGGTLPNVFAGEDRGVPPSISGRIYYLAAE